MKSFQFGILMFNDRSAANAFFKRITVLKFDLFLEVLCHHPNGIGLAFRSRFQATLSKRASLAPLRIEVKDK